MTKGGFMANDRWQAPTIVPSLAYDDVPRAVAWLERVFGVRERRDARLTWAGGAMAWVEIGDGLVNLSTSDGHATRSPDAVGGTTQSLKVYVDDVDAHFAQAKALGAVIDEPPRDGFWGGRIYRARDLEGHPWEFSQGGRDLAAAAWKLPPGITRGAP
jgi:PhnB protein